MNFKNSFLAFLFGTEPESMDEEEPLLSPPPEQEPDQPERLPRHELSPPRNHSFYRLWDIGSEQSGVLPRPALFLEGPSDPPMPEEEARTELLRLQMFINSTANGRFERLRAQTKAEGEEAASLPDLDAQAAVLLSKDCLTAWLLVYPPVGAGRPLDREMLDQALVESQIYYGVDQDLLDALPQDPECYFHLFPLARGDAAIPGADGWVVDLFPRTEERKLTIDENNRVDYANLNFIHNIEKGGTICRVISPTEGTPGRTVQDREIPAKGGRAASAPKGRNTHLSEDGSALLASIAGHVEFSGRTFQVKPVLDIPGNVDFSVGNINFLGDVCIHGDICSGFTVRAMGNITVAGVVESCTVEAGRDLVVARGVQGDGQAVIRAQRNVFVKYLENCCVYARTGLETECIINCDVYCNGSVTVRSGHRSIIGGNIRAAHEVSAGVIGSRVGNRTDIVLGGQPCEDFDYDLLTREIQELEQNLERTERQPDSPSKLSRMSKLRMQLSVSRSKLEMSSKEREQLAQEWEETGLRRMVCDTVFPGTVLTIGGAVHHFDYKLSPCSATLAGDEIRLI